MKPFIKICGITRKEDVQACVENKVDAIGFILARNSLRTISLDQLAVLVKGIPKEIIKVGVTVDQDIHFIAEAVAAGTLDVVQLHGNETEDFAMTINCCEVWKAVSLASEEAVVKYRHYPARIIIADSKQGGSGQRCNWDLAARLAQVRKVVLAGGITPDNASLALKKTHAFGIDLSSGVEIQSGLKSRALIHTLVARLELSQQAGPFAGKYNRRIKNAYNED